MTWTLSLFSSLIGPCAVRLWDGHEESKGGRGRRPVIVPSYSCVIENGNLRGGELVWILVDKMLVLCYGLKWGCARAFECLILCSSPRTVTSLWWCRRAQHLFLPCYFAIRRYTWNWFEYFWRFSLIIQFLTNSSKWIRKMFMHDCYFYFSFVMNPRSTEWLPTKWAIQPYSWWFTKLSFDSQSENITECLEYSLHM